jgi:hypothetical protein
VASGISVTVASSVRSYRNSHPQIPADFAGTDPGKSYDAEELLGVQQQKCLDHLKENIHEALEPRLDAPAALG